MDLLSIYYTQLPLWFPDSLLLSLVSLCPCVAPLCCDGQCLDGLMSMDQGVGWRLCHLHSSCKYILMDASSSPCLVPLSFSACTQSKDCREAVFCCHFSHARICHLKLTLHSVLSYEPPLLLWLFDRKECWVWHVAYVIHWQTISLAYLWIRPLTTLYQVACFQHRKHSVSSPKPQSHPLYALTTS